MTGRTIWSLRSLYMYIVCLITLVMVIVAAVNLVRAVAGLIYPDPGYYIMVARPTDGGSDYDAAEYERQQENQRQQSLRQSVLSLVGNGAMLLLAGPIYLYHWRRIERDARSPGAAT